MLVTSPSTFRVHKIGRVKKACRKTGGLYPGPSKGRVVHNSGPILDSIPFRRFGRPFNPLKLIKIWKPASRDLVCIEFEIRAIGFTEHTTPLDLNLYHQRECCIGFLRPTIMTLLMDSAFENYSLVSRGNKKTGQTTAEPATRSKA